jgi:hypothetical protein
MKISEQIEKLRDFPSSSSDAFREQLERARISREQMDGPAPAVKGIDRSGELTPIARPTIVRFVVEPA